MTGVQDDFSNLDGAGRATAALVRRPKTLVYGVLVASVALSWAALLAMAVRGAETRVPGAGAPGDALLKHLPDLPLPAMVERFFALCLAPQPLDGDIAARFGALTVMWLLMSLAMMLPSATPMIRTYCEIADTARAKGEPVVHPLVLVAGYITVWLVASAGFAALTLAVHQAGSATDLLSPVEGLAGVAALALAGLYQFSGLKAACLKNCRNPFSTLFARWSVKPTRIYRLGIEQGIWCLGCCWALMLVMFAVGVMNVFWMVLVGLFAIIEKQTSSALPTRLAGVLLLAWASALLLLGIAS